MIKCEKLSSYTLYVGVSSVTIQRVQFLYDYLIIQHFVLIFVSANHMFLGQLMWARKYLKLDQKNVDLSNISDVGMRSLLEKLLSFEPQQRYNMNEICCEIQKIRGKFTSLPE